MLTVNKLIPHGQGLAPVLIKRAATLELDAERCGQSRFQASDSQGRQLSVQLPEGSLLHDGDVLLAEDGSLLRVIAPQQADAPARGRPIGIAVSAAAVPHVHGPGCKH